MDDVGDTTPVSTVELSARNHAAETDASPSEAAAASSSQSSNRWAISHVCVYSDRAEVTRSVTVGVPARKGAIEVVLKHLPPAVETDSVRVGALTATTETGPVLLEVSSRQVHQAVRVDARSDDNSADKERQLAAELEQLKRKQKLALLAVERLAKQRAWLDEYGSTAASSALTSSVSGGKVCGNDAQDGSSEFRSALSGPSLMDAANFLKFREAEEASLDARKIDLEEELAELGATISAATANLAQRRASGPMETTSQVTTLLYLKDENKATGDQVSVSFDLTYVVLNQASWKPLYDCRVDAREETIELVYSGSITNNTREDWTKCRLSLSTARPAVGGAPPTLPLEIVRWRQPKNQWLPREESSMAGGFDGSVAVQSLAPPSSAARSRLAASPEPRSPGGSLMANVSSHQDSSSATFAIPRLATVPSDNRPHKLTICRVSLGDIRFSYAVTPALNETVFLKVSTENASEFSLLAGKMAIFLDGSFVATSDLKAVPPGDKFAFHLGADETVIAEFKPVKRSRQKVSYMLSKSQKEQVEHSITIKNTKKKSIFVTVVDAVAKSETDQIKVKIVEPDVENFDTAKYVDVKLNKKNHVEWRLSVAPGAKATIPLTYTVEWPANQEIETITRD